MNPESSKSSIIKNYFVKPKTRLYLGNYLPKKSIPGKMKKVIFFLLDVRSCPKNIVFYYVHGRAFLEYISGDLEPTK